MKKTAIHLGLVLMVLAVTGISNAAVMDSAVGIWLFDEGSGEVTKDYSGNGNDGTLVNGPAWTSGKFGQALQFDGVDDYVEIPTSPLLDPGLGDMTYTAWIKTDVEADLYLYHNPGGGSEKAEWRISNGKVRIYVRDATGANTWRDDNILVHDGEWHFVATVWKGSESPAAIDHYVDGVLDNAEAYGNQQLDGSDLQFLGGNDVIGIRQNDWVKGFNGVIDEFAIFNTALSADEIVSMAAEGLTPSAVSASDKLISVWGAIKNR